MTQDIKTISSQRNSKIRCSAIPGHFATSRAHVNYYMDMIDVRSNHNLARLAAEEFARKYETTIIDTIICLEGTEVIGAFVAETLSRPSQLSVNVDRDINVLIPETTAASQMVFRENTQGMVTNKNILLLVSSIVTGQTITRAKNMLQYYNGHLVGISALYSVLPETNGISVDALFTADDLPDYIAHDPGECPMCQQKRKLDAVANGYGYTRLD